MTEKYYSKDALEEMARMNVSGELSEDDLDEVSGGVIWSIAIPLGIYLGTKIGNAINKKKNK